MPIGRSFGTRQSGKLRKKLPAKRPRIGNGRGSHPRLTPMRITSRFRRILTIVGVLLVLPLAACSRSDSTPASGGGSGQTATPATQPDQPAKPAGPRLFVTNETGGDLTVIDLGS